MSGTIDLTVVLPIHNECGAHERLVSELCVCFSSVAMEILVVDDGSSPALVKLQQIPATYRFIRHPRRMGSGYSRRMASRLARGQWVAWMDGDLTYDPQDLLRLWEVRESWDQVIGQRTCEAGSCRYVRRLVKGFIFHASAILWRMPIPDLNSGMRLMRRESLACWVNELPDGFSCTSTATLAALNRGQRIKFVPIGYHSRQAGTRSKFHPLTDTARLLATVLRQYRQRPIPG